MNVGLSMGLNKIGKKTITALREPSLGPVFGVKGGAAGGGYAQVVPMEDINLHFTGDFHAITSAHNLLAAMLDNHLHQGNALDIDPKKVVWRRVLDMNDRSLRNVIVGLGGKPDGFVRQTGFDITVASEIMAILCLATSIYRKKDYLRWLLLISYCSARSGKYAVADPERATLAAFDQTNARRRPSRHAIALAPRRHGRCHRPTDAQHRHLGHAARLVEGASGREFDQPFVRHVLEQALEVDLVLPRQPERPRDLALPRRLVGRGDEIEDLLAAGQAGGRIAGRPGVVMRGAAGEFSVFGALEPCPP